MCNIVISIGIIIIILLILVLVLALCKGARIADDQADYLYYITHRGEDNGNDTSEQ